jgi:hypothetical protein
MATWKRWTNLIVFLLISIAIFPGVIAFFVMILGLIALYARLGSSYVPLGSVPISYCFIRITPAIEYLLMTMNLRRSKRIRAFLELADYLRMRKKRIDGLLPRRPRS